MQKALTPQYPSENDCLGDDAVEDAEEIDTQLLSSVSIGGRPLYNDINLLGSCEEELQQLTERFNKAAAGFGMEINSDNSKIRVNSINPKPSTNIRMNGKTLEEEDQFKYLGSV